MNGWLARLSQCVLKLNKCESKEDFFFVDFLIRAVLTSVRWYFIAVLICISMTMMLRIFSCAIFKSSLEKCLFKSSIHFLTELFVLISSCMNCLPILVVNLLLSYSFANIFSHSEGRLFILLYDFFCCAKVLSLIRSHLFIFVFIFIMLGGISKKILLQFMWVFCLYFPLRVL